jgi:hypothetical protein
MSNLLEKRNPFDYEAANNLDADDILDVYIEDHNYSRFITSTRNTILVGERGCGKTMTLIYNSFKVQSLKRTKLVQQPDYTHIGIYSSCNNPIMQKPEYQLLPEFKAILLSEHYLVLNILYSIADAFDEDRLLLNTLEKKQLCSDIKFVLGWSINPKNLFRSIKLQIQKQIVDTQKYINESEATDIFYDSLVSFSSALLPFIQILKSILILKDSHFLLMIDDAHDSNKWQFRLLNTWLSYRDRKDFSFKIATTKLGYQGNLTLSGGIVLEGHDFTRVDMERPLQNDHSEFGHLAKLIIEKRLQKSGFDINAEEFFPEHKDLREKLIDARKKMTLIAQEKYPKGSNKQINDFVYKMYRAQFFRDRGTTANLPPYSGFETITHLSTGVIRNLLEPCYWMFERTLSNRNDDADEANNLPPIGFIESSIQAEVMIDRSERKWSEMRDELYKVVGCSIEHAKQVYQMMDQIFIFLRDRLLTHSSEPRAGIFIVSSWNSTNEEKLRSLLETAQKAQYLYTKNGPSKDDGTRETNYAINRLLFPARNLDIITQHARISIKAQFLLNAAENNTRIKIIEENDATQQVLFDE